MFSDLLVSSKSKNHLLNLLQLAKVDGLFHLNEYEFLLVVARKLGISVEYIQKIQKRKKNINFKLPQNPSEKFHYWYDLMNMVLADNVVHEKELEYCTEMAKVFGYKPEAISITLQRIQEGITHEQLYDILQKEYLIGN